VIGTGEIVVAALAAADVWTTDRAMRYGRKERNAIVRRIVGSRPVPALHAAAWASLFVLLHLVPIVFHRWLAPMPASGWWLLAAPLLYVVVSNYRLGTRSS
jgi:hypothetical protein